MALPTNILVPTDFSPQAARALDCALELARAVGAKVHLLHAYTPPTLYLPEPGTLAGEELLAQTGRDADDAMLGLLREHSDGGVSVDAAVVCADARVAVVEKAKAMKADLIVMGTHGRRGLGRALMGSVAEAVVRTAPCSVWVVR